MYSKNDYRYYLEAQLMHSDDFLAHYGVLGMKWGQRKQAYIAKRTSNEAKIADYQKKLNTIGAQKRAAKAAKYQAKLSKIDKKASKARAKLAKGKNISSGQMKKIAKAERYREKIAKNSAKNDKYQMKINKLRTKNAKIDKKIHKGDIKEKIKEAKTVKKDNLKKVNKQRKELSPQYHEDRLSFDSNPKRKASYDKKFKDLDALEKKYKTEYKNQIKKIKKSE